MTSAALGLAHNEWEEVLRASGCVLQGRVVGVWESDERGRLRPIAASLQQYSPGEATRELETALHDWRVRRWAGRRWVASRLGGGRWCIAPVRKAPPDPPPKGLERRGPERMALELAGICLGMIGARRRSRGVTGDPASGEEDELDEFFEHAPFGLHWAAEDGTILRVSQSELDMLGYDKAAYVGHNAAEFFVDPSVAAELLRRLRMEETVQGCEARLKHGDGSVRHVLLSADARISERQFLYSRWLTRDITEIKRAEDTLAQFKAMVESANDAIIGKTLDGVLTYWNPGAEHLYGYAAAEVLGKSIALLIPPERPEELNDILERVRRGERVDHYETQRVRKGGARVDVSVCVSPILGPDGRPIGASAIARDVTARKEAEQLLRHGALHDPLTDLPNRALFTERVAEALDRARRDPGYRFAVLFLDLDDFKVLNDSLGHVMGDRLLAEMAGRLRACIRPGDVAARLGGDEFTVLLENVAGADDIEQAAHRIQRALAVPFVLERREVFATASIGVALGDVTYERPEDLLRDADIAMYRAKAQGRAQFRMFNVKMRDWAHARFGMESDLRNALERGEFRILFQPIVRLETGRVHAFEALLRWHHPIRGVIYPHEFIPLAEHTGFIVPIGAWVLREACWHARRWQRAFPQTDPVSVSVNISAKQLSHPGIVDEVRRALREEGLDPHCLGLEITESVLLENGDGSVALLEELRHLEVELHVDDFGTGYSSLSYLPRFPLQAIKVDRSFVHRMGARRTDQEIVRSIVTLAQNLGLGVIAEGVETAGQRDRLLAFGCELGQGFHFAQPLEPTAAREFLGASVGGGH